MTELKEDIREKLVLTAMALYAEKGLDGVSLRQIGVAAGAKNSGVMQYHFGNRLGLINAVIERITQLFMPLWLQSPVAETKDLAELVHQAVSNIGLVISSQVWGKDAVKVMSRMMMETDPEIWAIFNRFFSDYAQQVHQQVSTFYPDADNNKLQLRVLIGLDAIIHGASEWISLRDSPLGAFEIKDFDELTEQLSDFVEGGISFKL